MTKEKQVEIKYLGTQIKMMETKIPYDTAAAISEHQLEQEERQEEKQQSKLRWIRIMQLPPILSKSTT